MGRTERNVIIVKIILNVHALNPVYMLLHIARETFHIMITLRVLKWEMILMIQVGLV